MPAPESWYPGMQQRLDEIDRCKREEAEKGMTTREKKKQGVTLTVTQPPK